MPQLSVLIVDDEEWIAEELADGIESTGVAVRAVSSAAEALRILGEDSSIGVVVTDLRMPGQDGLSLARHLMDERPAEHALKLVVMTGHATIEDAAKAVRTGVFDFLRKPFALDEMLNVVEKALATVRRERRDAVSRQATASRLAMAEAETASLRDRDPQTGLPNRAVFLAALAAMPATGGAILIEVGRVGAVAEGGGRGLADDILASVAARLHEVMPGKGLLARTGDAEFGIVLSPLSETAAQDLAQAMLRTVSEPFIGGGHSIVLPAHAGFALASALGSAAPDAATQVALAGARRAGSGSVIGFTPAMHAAAARRLRIEQDLRTAIGTDALGLYFQPIVKPVTRKPFAFESLMRWRHAELGAVSPSEFIPLAEENGTIFELGALAVSQAARQAANWRDWIAAGNYISVNVSARQLSGMDMPALFASTLQQHGLPPSALVCELTESVATNDLAEPVLRALRGTGVRVALDDFGVGYSSLGMLRQMPVDLVKLDRSLIMAATQDTRGRQFLNGMTRMIGALGLDVIAEGVEHEEQLDIAIEAGCTGVQGYLLGAPMPGADASDIVTRAMRAA